MSRLNVAVVGGGVIGLCAALRLVRDGAHVTVFTPTAADLTASGVAAGMLAPAMESALELGEAGYQVLAAGRDMWPGLLSSLGVPQGLNRSGALWVALPGEERLLDSVTESLRQLDANAERLEPERALELAPQLSPRIVGAVHTPEDWTLEPRTVLRALVASLQREGAQLVRAAVRTDGRGGLEAEGAPVRADQVVLAVGAEVERFVGGAPELRCISPIKGQLWAFDAAPTAGVTIRTSGAYVAPQPGGAIVGATMEPGLADSRPDAGELARLRAAAARALPHLQHAHGEARVGIRASTPDGWPLVGRSEPGGAWLACGMRRNGWTLAPWIAESLLRDMRAQPALPGADLMHPNRFQRTDAP